MDNIKTHKVIVCSRCGHMDTVSVEEVNELNLYVCKKCGIGFTPEK